MTTVVLNTTTRKVEVFSSARDVQARAEIADHKSAADPHPQYISELDVAAVATSGDAADLDYAPSGTGALVRTAAEVFGEAVRITDYGGVGDDATDNSAARANAQAAGGVNRPIILNNGDYNLSASQNLYPSAGTWKDALGTQWLCGTLANPATRHEPVLWVEKISTAEREDAGLGVTEGWDQGAIYASLEKRGGGSYGAAITGYVLAGRPESEVTQPHAQLVGIHARAKAHNTGPEGMNVFGAWIQAGIGTIHEDARPICQGYELNLGNDWGDPGWLKENDGVAGLFIGATITTNAAGHPGTWGIKISGGGGAANTTNGWHTPLYIQRHATFVDDPDPFANGEAVRIMGSDATDHRPGGVRLMDGHFKYGLKTLETTFANDALGIFRKDQVMYWCPGGATDFASAAAFGHVSGAWAFTGGVVGAEDGVSLDFNVPIILGPDTQYLRSPASHQLEWASETSTAQFRLYRGEALAGASTVGSFYFGARNAGGTRTDFGRIDGVAISPTAESETGEIRLRNMNAGALTTQLSTRTGVTVGAPTGSFQGVGTLNLESALYTNGDQVVGARQSAISDAAGGTELATINAILAVLRSHGLIAT